MNFKDHIGKTAIQRNGDKAKLLLYVSEATTRNRIVILDADGEIQLVDEEGRNWAEEQWDLVSVAPETVKVAVFKDNYVRWK